MEIDGEAVGMIATVVGLASAGIAIVRGWAKMESNHEAAMAKIKNLEQDIAKDKIEQQSIDRRQFKQLEKLSDGHTDIKVAVEGVSVKLDTVIDALKDKK